MTAIPKPVKRLKQPRKRIPRGRRPARVRKRESRGALRELADDLMSLFVRCRGGWVCQRCGSRKWEDMQCAHIVRKGAYTAGRYREENAICLCAPCHVFFTHHEIEWRAWLIGFMGEGRLHDLEMVCQIRIGPHDYKAVAFYYQQKLLIRGTRWKVQERYDRLVERGRRQGVFP